MIHKKRISVGVFLKKGVDFQSGDTLSIASECHPTEGKFGTQDLFLLKTKDGKEGNVSFNMTTMNGLIEAYGNDDVKWIGKPVKALMIQMMGRDGLTDVWLFLHPEAKLTKNGIVLEKTPTIQQNGIPIIEDNEDEIDIKSIPF